MRALKELRLTADDFEVKGIIGRGHFGEVVNEATSITLSVPHTHMFSYVNVYIVNVTCFFIHTGTGGN